MNPKTILKATKWFYNFHYKPVLYLENKNIFLRYKFYWLYF